MPSSTGPLIIHSIGTENSLGIRDEISLLTSGEFLRPTSLNSNRYQLLRWSSPHITAYPAFFRLGTPADIRNLEVIGDRVVLGLDARVLLQHTFQLNVGWDPNEMVSQQDKNAADRSLARNVLNGIVDPDISPNIKVGDIKYPFKISGDVIDGRTIDEADLFSKLKKLDKSRRYTYSLNGPRTRNSCWMMSNEILVDVPVSLADSLRVVFIPDSLPPVYAKKIREVVSSKYPRARVKEYMCKNDS